MENQAFFDTRNDNQPTRSIAQCPVDYAFQRIGGKYKGRILWQLADGVMRYGDLRRAIPDVTPKMLTQALRELESDGLVNRHVYFEVPPKVEYSLTVDGSELIPFIEMVSNWAEKLLRKQEVTIIAAPKQST